MGKYAGIGKRIFAFFIDLTLVVVLTFLLWLFPFQFVVGNNIQENYKETVAKKADEIAHIFSGERDMFKASSTEEGYFQELDNLYSAGKMTEVEYGERVSFENSAYLRNKGFASNLFNSLNEAYDESVSYQEQAYTDIDELYNYLFYAYQAELRFPHNSEYVKYTALRDAGEISSDDELKTLEKEYQNNLETNYIKQLEILVRAMKYYDSKNEGKGILSLPVYKSLAAEYNSLSKTKAKNLDSSFTLEDQNVLIEAVDNYKAYYDHATSKETLGTTEDTSGKIYVNINDEAYVNFYYSLYMERVKLLRPYYIQTYRYSWWATVYALSMFVFLFSLYTIVLRGKTVGRRVVKIKLVDKNENAKLNPLLAFAHDIGARLLYVLLIGFYSLPVALIAGVVFTIVDALMIRYNKQNKTIRDIITSTKVIISEF